MNLTPKKLSLKLNNNKIITNNPKKHLNSNPSKENILTNVITNLVKHT